MSFDRLHPAVQHHIVNSLGWRDLRPLQEAAINPILAGRDAVLIAPTAGGKTEAAAFPLFSRMLTENWAPLSVLYVCPLRALLNNLEVRLSRYAGLLGRSVGIWHGDIPEAARRQIRKEPPDILLTTPESLEVMLVSSRVDCDALFGGVRAVVVDELHAFAADDRGWHLLAVLERVSRWSGKRLQRVGLSATVGNPDELLAWLSSAPPEERQVVKAAGDGPRDTGVRIDAVGDLANAATLISRLHRGEKRLVFCDSRSRVEDLAFRLRGLDVQTFVSHSSLGVDERRRAEAAFAEGRDCVIVATSTLELGIDVGDLDRVIQIDSPRTVAGFLQRLGRSGRRAGTLRNMLFATTSNDDLLLALGVVRLWQEGYVEPLVPPVAPVHVVAQQLLGLVLQQAGKLALDDAPRWLAGFLAKAGLTDNWQGILASMLEKGILFDADGLLALGPEGEKRFRGKGFLDVLSVFTTAPLFTVFHGGAEIGRVDAASFQVRQDSRAVLLLGGRPWAVRNVDWDRMIANVEPVPSEGRSLWPGDAVPCSFRLCQAMRDALLETEPPAHLTRRGAEAFGTLQERFGWLSRDSTALVREKSGRTRWWTFAGLRANATLADALARRGRGILTRDNLSISFNEDAGADGLAEDLRVIRDGAAELVPIALAQEAADMLKFSYCLSAGLALGVVQSRLADPPAVVATAAASVARVVNDCQI